MSVTATEAPATPKPRRWPWFVAIAVSFFVGIGIGAAGGGDTEPAADETPEPQPTATVTVTAEPSSDLGAREAALDERESELSALAAELDEREAAITEQEEAVAANTVGDGVWVVGDDIEPGTYRATDVSSDCYWAITVTGSNGADIVNNGIPGGGNPQVTVEKGQDFESARCGEWVKQ